MSLDVVVRQDLLRWLRRESETRGATILYATHIFDGLDDWPTHLHYLCNKGHTGWQVNLILTTQHNHLLALIFGSTGSDS